jgi:hypothetical protein
MKNNALRQEMFHLVGYLLTSAHGLYEEPPGYGPFRLLDTTGRLLAILEAHALSDPFLDELKTWIDQERFGSSSDQQLREGLNRQILKYTQELKRRTEKEANP